MSFKTEVLTHMGDYKRDILSIEENGKWWINKKENRYVTHDHILPVIDNENLRQQYSENNVRKLNLLSTYRNTCWAYLKKERIKLHRFYHHLNSSQSMCVNFFYPFVVNDLLKNCIISVIQSQCLEKIAIETPNLMKIKFEYESELDKYNGQYPTNFDLCISDASVKLLFEVKYTEDGFGRIDKQKKATYEEKYTKLYKQLASKVIAKKWNTCENFLENYQLMRNLVHIDDSTYLIFLYPKFNATVNNQANKAREFVKPEYQDKLICLTWETLYNQTIDEVRKIDTIGSELKQNFIEFKDKYLFWMK